MEEEKPKEPLPHCSHLLSISQLWQRQEPRRHDMGRIIFRGLWMLAVLLYTLDFCLLGEASSFSLSTPIIAALTIAISVYSARLSFVVLYIILLSILFFFPNAELYPLIDYHASLVDYKWLNTPTALTCLFLFTLAFDLKEGKF